MAKAMHVKTAKRSDDLWTGVIDLPLYTRIGSEKWILFYSLSALRG